MKAILTLNISTDSTPADIGGLMRSLAASIENGAVPLDQEQVIPARHGDTRLGVLFIKPQPHES